MVRAVFKYSLLSIFASTIPARTAKRRRTPANHGEMDLTIAQTFMSALHSFETRILRFRIEHLRTLCVVGTWFTLAEPRKSYLRDAARPRRDAEVKPVQFGHR